MILIVCEMLTIFSAIIRFAARMKLISNRIFSFSEQLRFDLRIQLYLAIKFKWL